MKARSDMMDEDIQWTQAMLDAAIEHQAWPPRRWLSRFGGIDYVFGIKSSTEYREIRRRKETELANK